MMRKVRKLSAWRAIRIQSALHILLLNGRVLLGPVGLSGAAGSLATSICAVT